MILFKNYYCMETYHDISQYDTALQQLQEYCTQFSWPRSHIIYAGYTAPLMLYLTHTLHYSTPKYHHMRSLQISRTFLPMLKSRSEEIVNCFCLAQIITAKFCTSVIIKKYNFDTATDHPPHQGVTTI